MTAQLLSYIPVILQTILFLVMLGMGLTLTITDFKRVGIAPKAVFIGLFNQIVFVPVIAFTIIAIVPMQPMVAMGLMIVACCPGGAVSNLFSHLAKGDTALSISLTAISSLVTIFTIPFILNFSLDAILGAAFKNIQLPFGATVFNIFKLTALPVLIGMYINHKFPLFSKKSKAAISWGSIIVIILALVLMIMKLEEIGNSWYFIKASFLGVILLNIATLSVGYFSAKFLKISTKRAATIAIESGMQNNVLGMTIALSANLLNEPKMAATAGVYGVVMCIIAVAVIFIFKKLINKQHEPTS
ncbi:BASS family bile acid:Na+ symporter [Maribacter vaceletii]|uniref:BASS family bile acid:Na+ symporter n=1 Tax=Maribacter vaceletii TaxID=1206816 RepID=A0A495EE80_9FLAO|nr:bile acid:sodium symporter family protein [Maribacter vaceletii]RKR15198.1 BASS family bile acid:Na+ symporter [Maribacter vaceletii]